MSRWVETRLRACSTNVRCCRWRDLIWVNVTTNPTADWIARQLTEAFPWNEAPHYVIRDRDGIYGGVVTRRFHAMGIRDKPIARRPRPGCLLEHAKSTIDGRSIVIGEVVFCRISHFFFRMTIFAAEGKHAAYAIHIKLGTWRKPCRFRHGRIGLRGDLVRHLGQMLPQYGAGIILVFGIAQEIYASDVTSDVSLHQSWIAGRPFTPRRTAQALVVTIDADCILQHVEAGLSGKYVEWSNQHGGIVLFFFERLPAREHTSSLFDFIVCLVQARAFEEVQQDKGVSGRECIDRDRFALNVGNTFDFGNPEKGKKAIIAPQKHNQIGP